MHLIPTHCGPIFFGTEEHEEQQWLHFGFPRDMAHILRPPGKTRLSAVEALPRLPEVAINLVIQLLIAPRRRARLLISKKNTGTRIST